MRRVCDICGYTKQYSSFCSSIMLQKFINHKIEQHNIREHYILHTCPKMTTIENNTKLKHLCII